MTLAIVLFIALAIALLAAAAIISEPPARYLGIVALVFSVIVTFLALKLPGLP